MKAACEMRPCHRSVLSALRRLGGWRTAKEVSAETVPHYGMPTIATALQDLWRAGAIRRKRQATRKVLYLWMVEQ